MLQVELTKHGYLHMPAALAQDHFPGAGLVVLLRPPELWLLPTRGPAAGGLLLKWRNRHGDRSVLLRDLLPVGVLAGPRQAFWDPQSGALRVALL